VNTVDFIRESVTAQNSTIIDDVKELTPEQVAWKPVPKANPIGFIFWHCLRAQDNIIDGFQEKPSIWESNKWHKKLDMDAKASGQGFDEAQVDRVAALPISELIEYAEHVAKSTEDYLKSLKDTDLDRAPDPNRPRRTIAVTVRAFIIAHGWWHIVEIKYLKGLQGLPFAY